MNAEGMLNRKELAESLGIKCGTFWRKMIDYNERRGGLGEQKLQPDRVEINSRGRPQFWFLPEKAALYQAAIDEIDKSLRGRGRRKL